MTRDNNPTATEALREAVKNHASLGEIKALIALGAVADHKMLGVVAKDWTGVPHAAEVMTALIQAGAKPTTGMLRDAVERYASLGEIRALTKREGGAVSDQKTLGFVAEHWSEAPEAAEKIKVLRRAGGKATTNILRGAVENYASLDVIKALTEGRDGAVPDQKTIDFVTNNWIGIPGIVEMMKDLSKAAASGPSGNNNRFAATYNKAVTKGKRLCRRGQKMVRGKASLPVKWRRP